MRNPEVVVQEGEGHDACGYDTYIPCEQQVHGGEGFHALRQCTGRVGHSAGASDGYDDRRAQSRRGSERYPIPSVSTDDTQILTQNVFHSRIPLTRKIGRDPATVGRNKFKGTKNRRKSRSGTNVGSRVEV